MNRISTMKTTLNTKRAITGNRNGETLTLNTSKTWEMFCGKRQRSGALYWDYINQ